MPKTAIPSQNSITDKSGKGCCALYIGYQVICLLKSYSANLLQRLGNGSSFSTSISICLIIIDTKGKKLRGQVRREISNVAICQGDRDSWHMKEILNTNLKNSLLSECCLIAFFYSSSILQHIYFLKYIFIIRLYFGDK